MEDWKRGSGGGVEGVPVLFFLRCCHEVSGRVLMRPRGDLEDSYVFEQRKKRKKRRVKKKEKVKSKKKEKKKRPKTHKLLQPAGFHTAVVEIELGEKSAVG